MAAAANGCRAEKPPSSECQYRISRSPYFQQRKTQLTIHHGGEVDNSIHPALGFDPQLTQLLHVLVQTFAVLRQLLRDLRQLFIVRDHRK